MKEVHPHMTENVWDLGSKKQKESNVLVVRLAAKQNSKNTKELRVAIVKTMIERNETSREC